MVGILSVAMGMILAYGLCSLFGLFYSAAHTVIPFLLLGIGIDNIFVITQVILKSPICSLCKFNLIFNSVKSINDNFYVFYFVNYSKTSENPLAKIPEKWV